MWLGSGARTVGSFLRTLQVHQVQTNIQQGCGGGGRSFLVWEPYFGLACIPNGSLKEPGLGLQEDLLEEGMPDTDLEGCVGKSQVDILENF